MSTSVSGHPGTDGDHGLQLQPTVSWPHTMTVGIPHLVEADLDLVTADGTPPAVWPFDEEEYAYTCLLAGGDYFSVWAVRDPSVVVHRFGGSYGPAQFVVTPKARQAADDGPDSRSLRLTILNPWGVPVNTYPLDVEVRPDGGEPRKGPTGTVPSPGSQQEQPGPADGQGGQARHVPQPPPEPVPDRDEHHRPVPDGATPPTRHDLPPTRNDARPVRSDRPPPGALNEQYGLVVLRRSRSGSLRYDRVPLFGPGAATGSTVGFTVRCLPADDHGTVFAILAESPFDPDAPPRLIAMRSAKVPAATYRLSAELVYPYPGHVRIDGLPVPVRDDPRLWEEIVADVPSRLPAGTGPAHLTGAIEISGDPAMVHQRIARISALFEHVAEASAETASYSVITYGPHSINRNTDRFPEIPATTLVWAAPIESALDTLGGLARHGALPLGYPSAAQLECVLAEFARRLTGREGHPVLVTAGVRPPHPSQTDPETHRIPCPWRHDGLVIRRWLEGNFPGMRFGAIRDSGPEDTLWEQLGSDVTNGGFHAPDFAARLGLTGQPVQLLPLPLLAG